MYPITSYPITPDLLGRVRWQAEIDGQHSRFARRSYSRDKAERKISRDENLYWEGHISFMQRWFLPMAVPFHRRLDKVYRAAQQRRKVRHHK